jgi:hypothetical protein
MGTTHSLVPRLVVSLPSWRYWTEVIAVAATVSPHLLIIQNGLKANVEICVTKKRVYSLFAIVEAS